MKKHWTERSIKDYVFRIAADFIAQLENKTELLSISQDELSKKLGVTKGRVSQIFNRPGNITLAKMAEYARALGMKVSIVAYEDNDPENKKGPINSEVFRVCWEQLGKPHDFWAMGTILKTKEVGSNVLRIDPFEFFPVGISSANLVFYKGDYPPMGSLAANQTWDFPKSLPPS